MEGHHLVLGELTDYLTGAVIPDTHDERYRQQMARLLVETKGYGKAEVAPRTALTVTAGDRKGVLSVDFSISLSRRVGMMIKYGPGSLVTRHRPALAMARILEPYQIPVVVVTNGREADVLDGPTGDLRGRGMAEIPDRRELQEIMAAFDWRAVDANRAALESRIVYCYEIDGACPCDTSVCRLP